MSVSILDPTMLVERAVPAEREPPLRADADLLRRAHRGDGAASRELLRRYGPKLVRIVQATHGDKTSAEDVVQETFVRAFAEANQLRDDAGLFAWLVRIAIRISIDHRRKRRFEILPGILPDREATSLPSPEKSAASSQDAEAVRAALSKLSPRWREMIVLRYFAGFSVAEIAEIGDRTEVAVRKDLERARGKLRKLLSKWFEDDR